MASVIFVALFVMANAQDSRETVNKEISKPMIRGGLVYKTYCVLCHGERGDGVAHTEKNYSGLDLAINAHPHEYYERVIRHGSHGAGMSSTMPAWQYELSDEQINDVISYLVVVKDPVRRGEVIYKTNCILCHGINADGKGRAAGLFSPAPADLTQSTRDDDYKREIIHKGSKAMDRSAGMPSWEDKLTDTEIQDLIDYLRTVLVVPSANQSK
ncbi:MAG TPA: c-type cytochrome [Terriglobales bacterium]|nr:c-type cytochrome [Terriglobales bacterium]